MTSSESEVHQNKARSLKKQLSPSKNQMFVMERQTESNRQSGTEEGAKHEFNESDSEDFIAVNIYEGN